MDTRCGIREQFGDHGPCALLQLSCPAAWRKRNVSCPWRPPPAVVPSARSRVHNSGCVAD
eukprot:363984-Chlamydomonas_euryale.AAC.8